MRLKEKHACFLAFTAFFAVLASMVFWGTWSLDVCPVMPDCAVSYPLNNVAAWFNNWLSCGKFVPGDVIVFLGSPYFWTELQYVVALYCAALGMAYFLRGRKFSRLSSYGAGLFLAFSGYWCTLFSAGHLGWFQWMTYGVFAFGLIDRAVEKSKVRHWLLLGAVLAWGSFYQPDLWLLFSVFQFAYFVFRLIVKYRDCEEGCRKSFLIRMSQGALITFMIFAAIGWPSFRYAFTTDLANRDKQIAEGQTVGDSALSDDQKRWIFTTNWSMPPEDTIEFLKAGIHGDTSCPLSLAIAERNHSEVTEYSGRLGRPVNAKSGNYRQHSLHVGSATIAFALCGILFGLKKRNSFAMFFIVSAFLFWLFSMGRYCEIVYRLVYMLPFGDYLRAPVKWHHLTEFSLVVLCAIGFEEAIELIADKRKAKFIVLSLVVFSSIVLAGNAKKYCAPRPADAELQFADLRQVRHPQVQAQLRAQGIRDIGVLSKRGAALLAVPKKRTMVKLEPVKIDGSVLTPAIFSVLTSFFVLVFLIVSVLVRRKKNG